LTSEQKAALETISLERLRELACQSDRLARIVAANYAAPAKLLAELAIDSQQEFAAIVTANPNAPADVLLRLGVQFPKQFRENPVFDLRLLDRPNLCDRDQTKKVRVNVANNDNSPVSLLEILAQDPTKEVCTNLTSNPNTPVEILVILARNDASSVRCYGADNSKTSVEILGILVIDRAIDVCSYATKNLSRQKA
jgi:hypothetical protein